MKEQDIDMEIRIAKQSGQFNKQIVRLLIAFHKLYSGAE